LRDVLRKLLTALSRRSNAGGGEIMAADGLEGPEVMGRTSPWLAYVGLHDGTGRASTVLFLDSPTNVRFPGKWFVRNDPYACVSLSFMFDEEYSLEPGEGLVLDYRVVFGDGAWPRERIEDYVDGTHQGKES
jgi:Methane oxygenase PmoA